MKCYDFDITQFVATEKDMKVLIDSANPLILKALRDNWQKKSRLLAGIKEIEISVGNSEKFKVQQIFIDTLDITQDIINKKIKTNSL